MKSVIWNGKILIILFMKLVFLCSNATAGERYDLDEFFSDIMHIAIPLSAAVYSASIGDWQGELQLTYSYAMTIGTTLLLKRAVDAKRPNGGRYSFPSGHTSSAFAGAAYWQMRYGWEFGVPMYAAAALVAYQRVDIKAHYWRDIIAGATIGIGFNYLFTRRYGDDDKSEQRMSLIPTHKGVYFNFSMRF